MRFRIAVILAMLVVPPASAEAMQTGARTITVDRTKFVATPAAAQNPNLLCVLKYNDLNGDGRQEAGEPPLSGVTFAMGTPGGFSQVTDSNGRACFPVIWLSGNTRPGGTATAVYDIFEAPQAGWTNTEPGGAHKSVTLTQGQVPPLIYFGNHHNATPTTGQICVFKYEDINGDGHQQSNEGPLSGWSFRIADYVLATGADGKVCFSVPAGSFTVIENAQLHWANTDPGGPAPQKTVTVAAGQIVNIAFGNHHTP
jgi:large repetitive protein